ncbi:MAG: NAD(P)-dependent oxidoreductase [Anaerolineales bacterium]|nr:NAD(P)-dependent oxidoreductase [Anaerolineales bacterium]
MAHIAFIGLGVMGGRMVKRLLDAGHTVTGYNRTRSKAEELLSVGMYWAATPRAAAEVADITLSIVSDTKALREIAEGPEGVLAGLGAGKVYVDMSTVSPAVVRELAAKAAAQGAAMLDSPVSGSVATLEQGQLTMMVAGDPEAFKKAEPVLLDIGMKATYVGESGQAVSMKIAVNLNIAAQMLALSESVLLAEKAGIPRQTALDVLTNSVVASPLIKYKSPFLIEMPDQAWFNADMMRKDIQLALDLADEVGANLPVTQTSDTYFKRVQEIGLGEKDFAIVIEALQK